MQLFEAYWLTLSERDAVIDLTGTLFDGAILHRNRPTGAYTLEIPSAAQADEYAHIHTNGVSSMARQHLFTHLDGALMFVQFEYETKHFTWVDVIPEITAPEAVYPRYYSAGGAVHTGLTAHDLISRCVNVLSDQVAYNFEKDAVKMGVVGSNSGFANAITDFAPPPLLTALRRLHPLAFYSRGAR